MNDYPIIFSRPVRFCTVLAMIVFLAGSWGCSDDDPVAVGSGDSSWIPADQTVYLSAGSCNNKTSAAGGPDDPFANQDCLQYVWDGHRCLILSHLNAGLNCCPLNPTILNVEPGAEGEAGTIILDETKVGGECDCYCLFDFEFRLTGVEPGSYELTVIQDLLGPDDPTHELLLDLLAGVPSKGIFCIERHGYPWPPY